MTKKIFFFISILIGIFIFANVQAAIYYLSNTGNDLNDGLSTVFPWESITKLNLMMTKILPGDMILFERGSIFTGQINIYISGNENNSIIFGAYGEGKNPIISGSIPIKKWSIYKDKIFKADSETLIYNLFADQQQMIIARYPNSGFLTIKEPFSNPNEGFRDGELNQPSKYWDSSNIRIRTTNWTFEHTHIKSYKDGAITFSKQTSYPTLPGWGYYFDNNLNELDSEHEWYFDKDNTLKGTVYFYSPGGLEPNNLSVEGSVHNFGFYSQNTITNIIIQDLEIKNQVIAGVSLIGDKSKIRIENCTFKGQIQFGLNFLNNSENCEINNCKFYNINGIALYLLTSTSTIVSNNIFRNIGMVPGYGTTEDAFGMSAIVMLNCDSNHIFKNIIDSVGHDGINCIGRKNVIEKNTISNSLLFLNDGAAIKCYGKNNENSIWRNNFIFNVAGNLNGTLKEGNQISANGIYLDAFSSNMKILDNTILNCGLYGITLYDGCNNNQIKNNICYGNPVGIEFHEEVQPMTGNSVINNIFFGLNAGQVSVMLKSGSGSFIPGYFDSNYYCNTLDETIFIYQIRNYKLGYDFKAWKKIFNNASDLNSKVIFGTKAKYPKLFKNMSDDTSKVLLSSDYSYKDLNLNNVYNSIIIEPWSSKILITNLDINHLPEINLVNGSLSFENTGKETDQSSQWYNLIGNNLSDPVIITVPEGIVVSLQDDINYSNTMSINPVDGKINRIIFVKLISNIESNFSDFIIHKSGSLSSAIKIIGNLR